MTDMTELSSMSARAYAAAVARGLNTANLLTAEDARGLDSGAWRGELLALVREAWGPDVTISESSSPSLGGHLDVTDFPQVLFRATGGTLADRRVAALEAAPKAAKVTT